MRPKPSCPQPGHPPEQGQDHYDKDTASSEPDDIDLPRFQNLPVGSRPDFFRFKLLRVHGGPLHSGFVLLIRGLHGRVKLPEEPVQPFLLHRHGEGADPEKAAAYFDRLVASCREHLDIVETGRFGANMQVNLVNDGPVTFWLET